MEQKSVVVELYCIQISALQLGVIGNVKTISYFRLLRQLAINNLPRLRRFFVASCLIIV